MSKVDGTPGYEKECFNCPLWCIRWYEMERRTLE